MKIKTILIEVAMMAGYTYLMFASAYTASKLTKVAIQYFS